MILLVAAVFLAFSNGANDNFKGVATIYASGLATFKQALTWATITTLAGSLTSIVFAQQLVKNFSGKGLVPDTFVQNPDFALAVVLAAASTVFLATKIGMPISTTHALVGGLVGAGCVAVGVDFNFLKLGSSFVLPLILSPIIATACSYFAYLLFQFIKRKKGVRYKKANENQAFMKDSDPKDFEYTGSILSIPNQTLLNVIHYGSAGLVSFSRGLNDTPKMVGLLIILPFLDVQIGLLIITLAIAIGGVVQARAIANTLSKKITPMHHGQAVSANLVTGFLVSIANGYNLPVSTTHVSVGAIFGIGMSTKQGDSSIIQKIVYSWVLTLPISALLSAILFYCLK